VGLPMLTVVFLAAIFACFLLVGLRLRLKAMATPLGVQPLRTLRHWDGRATNAQAKSNQSEADEARDVLAIG
jgi:hypothetical protein